MLSGDWASIWGKNWDVCLVTRQGAQDLGQTLEYLGLEDQGISMGSRESEQITKRRPLL